MAAPESFIEPATLGRPAASFSSEAAAPESFVDPAAVGRPAASFSSEVGAPESGNGA
jgi:hypothetical protein